MSTGTAPLASMTHEVEAGSSLSVPHSTYNNFWSTFKSVSKQPIVVQATQMTPSIQPLATQSTSVQNIRTTEPATMQTQSTSLRIRIPLKRSYQEDTTAPTSPRLSRKTKVIIQTLSFNFFLTLAPSISVTVARRTNNFF